MPTCPNCGEIIMEGDPYCSHCGTTLLWTYDDEEDLQNKKYRKEKRRYLESIKYENPYDYDGLNDLYHEGIGAEYLNHLNGEIAEMEKRYDVKFRDLYIHSTGIFVNFIFQKGCFEAIVRSVYDTSYLYNNLELNRDIITPNFKKLYSDENFVNLIKAKEQEINEKFIKCDVRFFGDELVLCVYFEGFNQFWLNAEEMILEDW